MRSPKLEKPVNPLDMFSKSVIDSIPSIISSMLPDVLYRVPIETILRYMMEVYRMCDLDTRYMIVGLMYDLLAIIDEETKEATK